MRQMRQKRDGVDGDADEPRSCDVGRGLGATTLKMFSQELERSEKKPVKLRWLRKLLKVMIRIN